MPPLPPITRNLMIACLAVLVLQQFLPLYEWFALWPLHSGRFMPWQPFTYAFLHGDLSHLFFNMLGLWMFGVELEGIWGSRRYANFLVASALAAAAVQLLLSQIFGWLAPTIGISGAIFGLLLAYGLRFPTRQILLFFVFPTTARNAVFIFGAMELVFGVISPAGGVAHFAHLGGLLGGWLMLRYWQRRPPF